MPGQFREKLDVSMIVCHVLTNRDRFLFSPEPSFFFASVSSSLLPAIGMKKKAKSQVSKLFST
jgi:hypothetical protein